MPPVLHRKSALWLANRCRHHLLAVGNKQSGENSQNKQSRETRHGATHNYLITTNNTTSTLQQPVLPSSQKVKKKVKTQKLPKLSTSQWKLTMWCFSIINNISKMKNVYTNCRTVNENSQTENLTLSTQMIKHHKPCSTELI